MYFILLKTKNRVRYSLTRGNFKGREKTYLTLFTQIATIQEFLTLAEAKDFIRKFCKHKKKILKHELLENSTITIQKVEKWYRVNKKRLTETQKATYSKKVEEFNCRTRNSK